MRLLSILPSLCAVLVLGTIFGYRSRTQARQVNSQVRRGHMTLQWIDKVKKTSAPNPHDVETITKKLNAKVVFETSEDQLIFFDPNYMKDSAIPITQTYSFIGTNGSPYFGGPLGGHLVSWDGTGHYSRNEQDDSGNYHLSVSGEGAAPLAVFSVFFQRGEFYGLATQAAGVSATIISTSSDGSSKGSRANTFTSQEVVGFEWIIKQGAVPPGWKVNVEQKPGTYRFVVTANFNESGPMGDSLKYEETASFTLEFDLSGEEDIEAVIIPQEGYEQWMPEAGDAEDKPGNSLEVRVVLQPKGQGGKKPSKTAIFRFELSGVSHEPGVCLNWPPKSQAKKTPDLRIDQDSNRQLHLEDSDGQSASSEKGLLESVVRIESHDWGAWGKLKVIATLDDAAGTQIVAHLKDKPDIEALSIPKDENNNHIADAWEEIMAPSNTAADSDDDGHPNGNGDTGDDLSLYEEYRGFRINGKHFRTDPNYKDVFFWDPDSLGTGTFSVSGFDLHIVKLEEISFDANSGSTNRLVLNFNHGYAHLGNKPVLWLHNGPLPGLYGRAECLNGGSFAPGLPKTCGWIVIDASKFTNPRSGYLDQPRLDETIAHESAHATNVPHHGDVDYRVDNLYEIHSDGQWGKLPGPFRIAAPGGQESGVENCIMRYRSAAAYEMDGGEMRWRKPGDLTFTAGYKYPPREAVGKIFCDSRTGTGVNDPNGGVLNGKKLPKAGNALNGDCMHRFSANDLKH